MCTYDGDRQQMFECDNSSPSDSIVSMSPSHSRSSTNIGTNRIRTKNSLQQHIHDMMDSNQASKTIGSDILTTKDPLNPTYNPWILKILETKVMDCLCADYSKMNSEKQMQQAIEDTDFR
jgi:hypothetical protein